MITALWARFVAGFLKPFLPYIVGVVVALVVTWGVYRTGLNEGRAECNAKAIQSQLDAARRDLHNAREGTALAVDLAARDARAAALNEKPLAEIAKHETTLPKADRDCRMPSPAELERMRRIR